MPSPRAWSQKLLDEKCTMNTPNIYNGGQTTFNVENNVLDIAHSQAYPSLLLQDSPA